MQDRKSCGFVVEFDLKCLFSGSVIFLENERCGRAPKMSRATISGRVGMKTQGVRTQRLRVFG